MDNLSRRRAIQLAAGATFTGATAKGGAEVYQALNERVPPPDELPHKLDLGFTFSIDQCHWLRIDPRSTFRTIANLGEFSWVRFGNRLSNPLHQTIEDLNAQVSWAKEFNLEIVQAFGPRNFHYPEDYLPKGLFRFDPDFYQKCMEAMYLNFEAQVKAGITKDVNYWQLGNEPFYTSLIARILRKQAPIESVDFIGETKTLVNSDQNPHQTIITHFLDLKPWGPDRKSWENVQSIADIAALDIYTQIESMRIPVPLIVLRHALSEHFKTATAEEIWNMEMQTRPWDKRARFSIRDLDNLFNTLISLFPKVGYWELEKAVKENDIERLNVVHGQMLYKEELNRQFLHK